MLNWLANALATRISRADHAKMDAILNELRRERDEQRKEVRALISEMEDVLEKFSRVVARQAMRRSRAMKAALEGGEVEEPQQVQPQEVDFSQLPAAERKALLRQRLRTTGLRRAAPDA